MSRPEAPRGLRVCLVTFGSMGDVHPMLAMGAALLKRGHSVTLMTNPMFEAHAARAGLAFEPIGEMKQLDEVARHPKLWHPIDGLGVMWRYLLRPALEPTYTRLAEMAAAGPCLCIASPVAMGARIAQERAGLPVITAYTAATMLRTVQDPMTIAQFEVPRWWPAPVRRLAWTLLDRMKLEPLVRPALDALRSRVGLPRLEKSVFGQWMHSPLAGIALFPHWFAPAATDWPAQVLQAGFPLYDGDAQEPMPPGLLDFLAAGPAPLVFMPGTGRREARAFFEAAWRACMQGGHRAVFLGPVDASLRSQLPASIHCADYAPFPVLLPRSRALVHHGGVGSSAQALRAGVPQLLLPHAYDQFDNAMRLARLGVARRLSPDAAGLAQMAGELDKLLHDERVDEACRRWARETSPLQASEGIVSLVEKFA